MSTLSKTMLIGNLGGDPTTVTFEGGGMITKFSIATTEHWKDQNGEKKSKTEWHSIVTRNKQAEICEKYLSKGDKVYVEGQNRTRKWTDANGVEKYTTEVHARTITFLSPKGQRQEEGSAIEAHEAQKEQPTGTGNEPPKDDLPF